MNDIPEIISSSFSNGKAVLKTKIEHVNKLGLNFSCEHYYYEDIKNKSVFIPDFLININLKNYRDCLV